VKNIKVLIIEDDKELNRLLVDILSTRNYDVISHTNGLDGLRCAKTEKIDIILLDLMLPYKSGDEIVKELRLVSNVPIIIISAKDMVQTKIDLFRMGADDYITKPFDIDELIARIENALRHSSAYSEDKKIYSYKDLVVNTDEKSVKVNDSLITLTVKEYQILELMIKNPKKVFTKANIFETVWNEQFAYDDKVINTHISNLRAKLKKGNSEYIETVWGMGYKMTE